MLTCVIECHDFWKEFRVKEVSFLPSPAGSTSGLGFTFPAELAATEAPIARQNSGSVGTASPNLVASPKTDNKRYADGLLERRSDGDYFEAPLSFHPINNPSVVAELAPLKIVPSTMNWEWGATSYIVELRATYRAYFENDGVGSGLSDIIRDCIWPFYSDFLDKLVGPVDRLAEFDRDDKDEVTSVTIYLLCTAVPTDAYCKIVERYTRALLPKSYQQQGLVNIQFVETEAMASMGWFNENGKRVWKRRVSWKENAAAAPLKMGDALMSPVEIDPDTFETGSAGPLLTTPNGQTFLYTNEHVVRPGLKQGERVVVTKDEKTYIGNVVFTSADRGEKENNATMRSTNSHAWTGVANLTDWALIKLQSSAGPVVMPDAGHKARTCDHVNGISHVPISGYGTAIGAASRRADGQPWKAPFANEGVPYTIGKGRWYGNEQELQCWTLACPQGVDKMEWYHRGLGINGDSGTGVVDCETGKVCALVLGQVKSAVSRLFRRALVIDMLDVKNDTTRTIAETCNAKMEEIVEPGLGANVGSASAYLETQLGNVPVDFEGAHIPMCSCGKGKGKGVESQTISLGSSLESGGSSSRSEYSESVDDEDTSSSVSSSRCHEEIFGIKSTGSFRRLSVGARVR
jgi:hypothetical protein